MLLHEILFFLVVGIMLVSALFVVFLKNPVYSVLSLLISLSCLSLLFLFLGSPFLAVLQMLIYAGAVLVLFLFVIMLLNLQEESARTTKHGVLIPVGAVLSLTFLGLLVLIILSPRHLNTPTATPIHITSVADLAYALFTTHFLPFEMTSFLMLVAVIGAVTLVRKPKESDKR